MSKQHHDQPRYVNSLQRCTYEMLEKCCQILMMNALRTIIIGDGIHEAKQENIDPEKVTEHIAQLKSAL